MEENPLQRHRKGLALEAADFLYPAELFVADANSGGDTARYLLDRLLTEGITESFVRDINNRLKEVRKGVLVQKSGTAGRIEIRDVWTIRTTPAGAPAVTLAFVHLLNGGAFEKLKACDADDCSNYHFRRGKWCSDTCGSRMRGKTKRKLDKQRQML